MNVACAFESVASYDYGTPPHAAGVQIANNGSSAFTVTCSELSGYFGNSGVVLNKTSASIAPGGSAYIEFTRTTRRTREIPTWVLTPLASIGQLAPCG